MLKIIIIFLIVVYFIKHYFLYPVKIGRVHLSVYFGIPGAGKTTVAAYLAKQYNRKKIPVFSNVPIKNTYKFDVLDDLGKFSITRSLIIIDEASICMNNRSYKSFPQHLIAWFKMHRHEKCEVAVFSQSYEDFEITVRRLTYSMYLLTRSMFPFFIKLVPIRRKIGINEVTNRPDDIYSFYPPWIGWLFNRRVFGPSVWHDFDSWESLNLPPKEFKKYDSKLFEKPKSNKSKKAMFKVYWDIFKSNAKFNLSQLKRRKPHGGTTTAPNKSIVNQEVNYEKIDSS